MPDIFINPESEDLKTQEVAKDSKVAKPKKKSLQEKSNLLGISNPLAAYNYLPKNVTFETKDKEEKVILFLRQHPVVLLPRIGITAFLILVPSFFRLFSLFLYMPVGFQIIVVMIWYLFVFSSMLEAFLGWFYNIYIITDERVIDIDFVSLMHKEVTDANIGHIEDVTYKTGGLVKTLVDYGDIFIQTAGEEANLDFLAVPAPAKVAKILQGIREEREKSIERVK
jgi:hypothetical protein